VILPSGKRALSAASSLLVAGAKERIIVVISIF